MHRILLAAIATLMLGACTAPELNFKRMSIDELALYNSTVSIEDVVYCFEDVRVGSHIRQKYCSSVTELVNALNASYDKLNSINQGTAGRFGF